MSQAIRDTFAAAAGERSLFIPYVTAGYPRREDTVPILLALEGAGADIIELGVPFTDPLADGATIQHANQIALEGGITFDGCLQILTDARSRGLSAPVLFMGYYNPVLAYGEERAAAALHEAGGDGFIIIDLPPEEAPTFLAACAQYDLSYVPLIAPTTADDRIASVAATADAFVYCVSLTGTTGERATVAADLVPFLGRVRAHTNLPIAVGFGISEREHVEQVSAVAEAVVIGSAIISAIDAADPSQRAQAVKEYVERVTGHSRTGGIGSA